MIILLGGGIVFLFQMHEAPCCLTAHRRRISEVASKQPMRPQILFPVSFEVSPSWNSLLLTFQTSFNQSFLWFLPSTKHVSGVGGRSLRWRSNQVGWGRCCIAMETGCLLSLLLTDICGFVWMSVRTAPTPQCCGVNVTQKSLLWWVKPRHMSRHVLTHERNPKQLLFSGSTGGPLFPQTYHWGGGWFRTGVPIN